MNTLSRKKLGLFIIMIGLLLCSCEKFLNPEQELYITEDLLYDDWYEYRSIEMGLYALQQELVEQLFVLGELRGDLVDITENADADLVEVYNFSISKTNKYASPTNFFKLISATNSFIRILSIEHPEILDMSTEEVTNYDRLYGEALCMRAWAYFNAVRIYGQVPYIPESLTSIEEINGFLESSGTYTDSVHIVFGLDGYQNDTTISEPITLEKQYYNLDLILDHFTNELENKIKVVGVDHSIDNQDDTWEVTTWNTFSYHALLGHMYLEQGDYMSADFHFEKIVNNSSVNKRYRLDNSFSFGQWTNIFTDIDNREHIYTIWFNKSNFQQNTFQSLFEIVAPHTYKLKPSAPAVFNFETVWRWQQIDIEDPSKPERTTMERYGIPSDYYRGFGISYDYIKNGILMDRQEYLDMLFLRADGDDRNSRQIMENVDTVISKYSINKDLYDQDANYMIYRAGGIHLYRAELYTYWAADHNDNGIIAPTPITALNMLNDGSNFNVRSDREELGVLGRVGLGGNTRNYGDLLSVIGERAEGRVSFAGNSDGVSIANTIYKHDPYTNEIIGYTDLTANLLVKQKILEEAILQERARELAFEGERFYDLMRIAKRRNDPSFLASKVAAKYPSEKRSEIEAFLMDETNWYINYFD